MPIKVEERDGFVVVTLDEEAVLRAIWDAVQREHPDIAFDGVDVLESGARMVGKRAAGQVVEVPMAGTHRVFVPAGSKNLPGPIYRREDPLGQPVSLAVDWDGAVEAALDWRGDPAASEELRERVRARAGRKHPERVGLTQGTCQTTAAGGACACDGSCLRPATVAELKAFVAG